SCPRRPPARQLSQSHDARGADHRARLRQDARAQSRAGGPLRADNRSGGDGTRAARRHELGARAGSVLMKAAAVKDALGGAAFQRSSCPGLTRASIPSCAVESATVTEWMPGSSPAMTTLN